MTSRSDLSQGDLFGGLDAYGHQPARTGADLKRQSLDRVASHAPEGWIDAAVVAIRSACVGRDQITSDDVWPLVTTPPEPRAMGAAFTEAARRGIIRKTDRVQNSRRPECHSRPVAVWEVC